MKSQILARGLQKQLLHETKDNFRHITAQIFVSVNEENETTQQQQQQYDILLHQPSAILILKSSGFFLYLQKTKKYKIK